MRKLKYIAIGLAFAGVLFYSCKKEEEVEPENPYDKVEYPVVDSSEVDTLDKNSLASIHQDIFQPKCATPGCHDGAFEPNFTTAMSSFSSLVYHEVIKNNADEDFTYRVVPGNTELSVLHERITNCCFVNTNDRMPQDNIGEPLPQEDIDRIAAWIEAGAKDVSGNSPTEPNEQPSFSYPYCIVDEGFPAVWETRAISHDTNRVEMIAYGSMIADTNMALVLVTDLSDDKNAIVDLTGGTLKFSYDQDDFSNPILQVSSTYLAVEDGIQYNSFSTATFEQDSIVYLRYYISDGDHPEPAEYPVNSSPSYVKSMWSIIVQAGSNQ